MNYKKSILAAMVMSFSMGAIASEGAWEPVFGYGWSDYDGKSNLEKGYDTKLLGLGYYLSEELSLELLGSQHNTQFLTGGNASQVDTLSLRGLYHLQDIRPGIVPYLALGLFGKQYDGAPSGDDSYGGYTAGVGLKTYFSERFAWRLELNTTRSVDAHQDTQFWMGISYAFGGASSEVEPVVASAPVAAPTPAPTPVVAAPPPAPPADGDKDGVLDANDVCPNTPMGVKVDARGCGIKVSVKLNVLFETNSSQLTATSDSEIVRLANFMTQYPETKVTIEGHTSSDGADKYNQWLSERRAESVAKAVVEKGVAAERVVSVGFGESKPVADNATAEGRAANRRVIAELEEIARK